MKLGNLAAALGLAAAIAAGFALHVFKRSQAPSH